MNQNGYGRCEDCEWFMSIGGCNVERDSVRCNLNRRPRTVCRTITAPDEKQEEEPNENS